MSGVDGSWEQTCTGDLEKIVLLKLFEHGAFDLDKLI